MTPKYDLRFTLASEDDKVRVTIMTQVANLQAAIAHWRELRDRVTCVLVEMTGGEVVKVSPVEAEANGAEYMKVSDVVPCKVKRRPNVRDEEADESPLSDQEIEQRILEARRQKQAQHMQGDDR